MTLVCVGDNAALMLFLVLKDEECAQCDEAWLGPCPQSQGLRLRWACDCDQCLRQRHQSQRDAYFFIITHDLYVIDSLCWIPHTIITRWGVLVKLLTAPQQFQTGALQINY